MPIRLTPAVKYLAITCFVVFIIQQTGDQFFGTNLLGIFGLVPAYFVNGFRFWQILTYSLLHADVTHLFLNLMMLVFVGGDLEALWGTVRFLKFYIFCTISAGFFYLLLQLLTSHGTGLYVPMVGASGGIYGLLVAYGIVFSERVLLFMMVFPMKAKHFIWVLAAIEFMSTVFSGRGGGVASIAHVGGMFAGFAYLWGRAAWTVWQKRKKGPKGGGAIHEKRKKAADHLKLIIDNEKSGPDEKPKVWH